MMSNFKENKLVFFEGGNAEKFVPKIQAVEKNVQAEKEKAETGKGKDDIVDESKVRTKINDIEKQIKDSPVNDKYKEKIGNSLATLLDKREQDLKKVDTKKEGKLKELFAKIVKDLDDFDKQPDVKEIYELSASILDENKNAEKLFKELNDEINKALGINLPFQAFVTEYLKMPGESRARFKDISKAFEELIGNKNTTEFGSEVMNFHAKKVEMAFYAAIYLGLNTGKEHITFLINQLKLAKEAEKTAKKLLAERKKIRKNLEEHERNGKEISNYLNEGTYHAQVDMFKKMEKYAESSATILAAFGPIVALEEEFAHSDAQKISALRAISGDRLKYTTVVFVQSEKNASGLQAKNEEAFVAASQTEWQETKERAGNSLLFIRRNIYLSTYDGKYKKSFDESQEKMTNTLAEEANKSLDTTPDKPDDSMCQRVKQETGKIVGAFDYIQRLQGEDVIKAFQANTNFIQTLNNLKRTLGEQFDYEAPKGVVAIMTAEANFDLKGLKKSNPELHERFLNIVRQYEIQAKSLAGEIIMQAPVMVKFLDDQKLLKAKAHGVVDTFDHLQKQLKSQKDEPSETFMNSVHGLVRDLTSDPFYKQLKQNDETLNFFRKIKAANGGLVADVDAAISRAESALATGYHYLQNIDKICKNLVKIKGAGVGWKGMFIDIAKFAAAVAGAVIAGHIVAMTGGFGAGPIAILASNLAISGGATLGGAVAEIIHRGDDSTLEGKQLLQSWAQGALVCGAAGLAAKPFGMAWGRGVQGMNRYLADSRFQWLSNFGKKGLQADKSSVAQFFHKETFGRELGKELVQETFEEGMEGMGRAIAPDNPTVAFLFSLMGSAYGIAKGVSKTGKFKPSANIDGHITDTGVELTYSDPKETRDFLKKHGASADILAMFDHTGEVDMHKDGLQLKIKKSAIPQVGEIITDEHGNKYVIEPGGRQVMIEEDAGGQAVSQAEREIRAITGTNEQFINLANGNTCYQGTKEESAAFLRSKGFEVEINEQNGHIIAKKGNDKVKLKPWYSRQVLDLLASSNYSPEKLMEAFKTNPNFQKMFEMDAGVDEGYTIEEHTLMVLKQFEKYFARENLPENFDKNVFRILLAIHDIGKGRAAQEHGNTLSQHIYTIQMIETILDKHNLNLSPEQAAIIKSLISGDPLGSYLKGEISGHECFTRIAKMARDANMPVGTFYKLLKIYYQSDASSYTEDAGGKKSLDSLFIFDPERGNISFRGEGASKISNIEIAIDQRFDRIADKAKHLRTLMREKGIEIESLRKFAKTKSDLALMEFIEGKINKAQFLQAARENEHEMGTGASSHNMHLSSIEKFGISVELENFRKRAEKAIGSNKTKMLQIISDTESILIDGSFGSALNHGTSSNIFYGLEESGGELLSSRELARRSIDRTTGEGDISGGDDITDVIYFGQGMDGAGTAMAYAEANTSIDGYRNPINFDIHELNNGINTYERAISRMEREGMTNVSENGNGTDIHTLKRELQRLKQALKAKQAISNSEDHSFPVMFGLGEDGLSIDRSLASERGYGKFLSGEVRANHDVISLVKNLEAIYVPSDKIQETREILRKIFKKNPGVADKIKIYSIDSLQLISNARGDFLGDSSVFFQSRKNSFYGLEGNQARRFGRIQAYANTP